jgi:hypothetical protein
VREQMRTGLTTGTYPLPPYPRHYPAFVSPYFRRAPA